MEELHQGKGTRVHTTQREEHMQGPCGRDLGGHGGEWTPSVVGAGERDWWTSEGWRVGGS